VSAVDAGGDMDQVRVDIYTARPGLVIGHGHTEIDRNRAELEELTCKPVLVNVVDAPGPQEGPG
jgi:small subunit ribosomal protein S3